MSVELLPQQGARPRIVIEIRPGTQGVGSALLGVWHARRLLGHFIIRDLKGRYRGTLLGHWWILLRPAIDILPYLIVFGFFFRVGPGVLPYFLYLLSGFAPWLLFGGNLNAAPAILTRARSLVGKVFFPRLIIPINALVLRCIDFVVLLIVVFVATLAWGVPFGRNVWALPLFILLLVLLSFGVGLIVTTACTVRADLGHGVPAGVRMVFYMSPIVYPIEIVPEALRQWYMLNPLTVIISGIRWSLFGIDEPSALSVAVALTATLVALWVGLSGFLRIERRLADIL